MAKVKQSLTKEKLETTVKEKTYKCKSFWCTNRVTEPKTFCYHCNEDLSEDFVEHDD